MKKTALFFVLFVLFFTAIVASAQTDYSEQISLIAANTYLWKQDYEYVLWGYIVTDLDRNGRLEIISASVQGTGFYTYILAFEVSEDRDSLKELDGLGPERTDSLPDIMVLSVPVYFDKETGLYYYIFSDMIRNGMWEYYENKRAVSISNGAWEEIPLVSKSTIYTDPDHFTMTCKDAEGNLIDEAQYDEAEQRIFGDLEVSTACFNWYMTNNEDFAGLTADRLIESLKEAGDSECRQTGITE